MRPFLKFPVLLVSLFAASCGTHVPNLHEPYESKSQAPIKVANIIAHVQCEIQYAVQSAIIADMETQELAARAKPELRQGRSLEWFEDYAAQMTLILTLEETGSVNTNLSLIDPRANAVTNVHETITQKTVTTSQNQTLGLSAAYSTKATLKETVSLFIPFKPFTTPEAIAQERANRANNRGLSCNRAGGRLIEGDLKLDDWLDAVLLTSYGDPLFASSLATAQKASKKDVIQHQVTFVVTTNGGINPSLKLVNTTVNQGATPFLFGQRARTQDVIITMGPNANGELSPVAQFTLLASQIKNATQGN